MITARALKNLIATGFGLGNFPFMPGTFGTLGGIVLYVCLLPFSLPIYIVAIMLAFIFGCWLCEEVAKAMKVYDHKSVVWDEIVGYCVAMIAVPRGLVWICAGFVLFRLFDIIKPWPISWVDKKMKNGLGMMLDDVLAGVAVCLILNIYVYLS
jgi:phosphatidylglycerophosphatase A